MDLAVLQEVTGEYGGRYWYGDIEGGGLGISEIGRGDGSKTADILQLKYNIGMEPSSALAYAMGMENHHPILILLRFH